ncbi:MAG: replicative DNA helicase [Bdellovibrionaceae bacterium]|nr:replicative DNA helicase [Pseudobdellovibrionaceae bacterium]|tara:strand:+ start:2900 stop:4345 length:1446 start_codon:yes stop_codon:yes gene_type:complete
MDSKLLEHKLPPQNQEAEKSVLGGLLLEQEAWDEVSDLLNEEDFYKPAHRKIYAAIRDLHRKQMPSDLVTVSNLLMEKGDLETVGGAAALAEMIDQTPSAANILSYAKIVHEKSLLRRVIQTSQGFITKAFEGDFESMDAFMDTVESNIFHLTESSSQGGLVDASSLVKTSLEKLESLYGQQLTVTGIPTGFAELDDMTSGFQPGELIVIAARPSMGKTAFSLNVALHAALKEKKKVAYFSVEMGKESLMVRMLANAAKIRMGDLRTGTIDDQAWPRLINTAAALSETGLFVDDTPGISPFEIRAKARRMKAKYGLDMIMVDYLQMMGLKQKVESREREVSEISKLLKSIAKELQIPVIALAQLNRGVEGRSDRRPMLSDLRESGSIEQDADVIGMLFREDYYDRDNPDIRGIAEVIIGKQRNGPTGTVKLRWLAEYGIFENLVRGPEAPMPSAPHPSGSSGPQKKPGGGKPLNFAPGAGS